jgi:hypothetical protein
MRRSLRYGNCPTDSIPIVFHGGKRGAFFAKNGCESRQMGHRCVERGFAPVFPPTGNAELSISVSDVCTP